MKRRPAELSLKLRLLTNLLLLPAFVLGTIFFGTVALAVSLLDRSGSGQHCIARLWARFSLAVSCSQLRVRGAEHLRRHLVAVYAANHTSYMDTPVIFTALPFPFRILAKKSLWKAPFIGWYLNRSGQVPIDVSSAHASLASLGAGVKTLRAGVPLFVFPEGGRTPDGELQKFFSGAAFLAIRAQVPLVPVALSGVYNLLPIHTRHFFPTQLTLSVGEPIETAGMTMRQTDELNERLRCAIQELLAEVHGEHSGSRP